MADGVVPVDAVRKPVDAAGRDVDLERETPAGGTGRAKEQSAAVPVLVDAHDTGGEVQHPGKAGQVERRRCGGAWPASTAVACVGTVGHSRGRSITGSPDAYTLEAGGRRSKSTGTKSWRTSG